METAKFEKIPDSLLTDISQTPKEFQETNESGNALLSEKQIFEAGQGTENTGFSGSPDSNEDPKATTRPDVNTSTVPLSAGNVVSGRFAVDLMDNLLPVLIVLGVKLYGFEMDKKALQLSEKEKGIISPAMQQYLDSININFNNPLYNLLFVMGAVYVPKMIEIFPDLKKRQPKEKPKEKQPESVLSEVEQAEKRAKDGKIKEAERLAEIAKLKAMSKPAAIKYVMDKSKIGREKAITWLNKNL